ncbi:MAG: hypothetical protein ACK5MV_00190 [Aminipila sp.]
MYIEINEKHILKSDPMNVWIEETMTTKEGKEYQKNVTGYHPNIEGALIAYKRRKINSLESHTIDELIKGVNSIDNDIKAFCESIKGAIVWQKETQ